MFSLLTCYEEGEEGKKNKHSQRLCPLVQISGPPFSPLPPGSGGIPGVCASRLLQGGTSDPGPQRASGPSLQQLGDRVDHQGAGRHPSLRTAHPGGVNGVTDRGGGCVRVEVLLTPFNKLTTKSNPCLERETPLESSCSYCGLLTIQRSYFCLFPVVLLSDSRWPVSKKNRHCLHFKFRTLVGDF